MFMQPGFGTRFTLGLQRKGRKSKWRRAMARASFGFCAWNAIGRFGVRMVGPQTGTACRALPCVPASQWGSCSSGNLPQRWPLGSRAAFV